jgi:hypothetical protein
MTTIVTAFITDINNIDFRSYDTYIEYGKKLLEIDVPSVCFLERHIYEQYFVSCLKDFPQTYFFMFEKTDNYLYQYIHEVTEYHLHTNNPKKDTIDYMFLQCHKTEFLRQVAQINPFQTTNFAWIDFGIFHMIKNDDDLKRGILHLSTKSYSSIRIASCVDLNKVCVSDVYKNVVWYFAGSVIGGHRDALIEYAEIMKQKCISIIQEKHHIMWEINIWYLLYKDHIHLFEPYHADHNLSVLLYY